MKYIIELEEEFEKVYPADNEETLYRAKGFKSLVFDQDGLKKLEPFESNKYDFDKVYDEAYQNGMNDAWTVATKIVNSPLTDQLEKIFGTTYAVDVLPNYTASEAIDKIREYKQNCDLKIGDEILFDGNVKGVVYNISDRVYCFTENATIECFLRSEIKKTGRYFPEIVEILKKVREG